MQDTVQVISEHKTLDQQLHIPAALTSKGLLIRLPLLRNDPLVKAEHWADMRHELQQPLVQPLNQSFPVIHILRVLTYPHGSTSQL
jgi:hypothetical protein